MSVSRLKYGICSGNISNRGIIIGKTLGIYGEGQVNKERIKNDIIPLVERKNIDFPIIIYSYYSQYAPSKTGLDLIVDARGLRFKPKRPRPGTKSYDWIIDEKRKIHRIKDFKVVHDDG